VTPQVPIVGVLMIVNGSMTILMGLVLAAMGPLIYTLVKMDGAQRNGMGPGDEGVLTVMSAVYLILGLVVLASGILNVFGGIRARNYRSRTVVLVALFANMISIFTCYCAPTSIGMMIYGLIVIFQPDVARAFELGQQGISPDEIRREFSGVDWRRRLPSDEADGDDESSESRLPNRKDSDSPDEGQFRA
jgi:hypothetical protein